MHRGKALFSIFALYFSCALAQSDLLVNTQYGPVLGHTTSSNKEWLGIPFAAPPVGNLRWQTPQPPTPWTTPYNASSYSKICRQTLVQTPSPPPQSEDCLYLNVFTPLAATPSSALPVYIYVYGGAWTVGYAQKYDGQFMAGQDMVVVTMNYRVGALGALGLPLLLNHSKENTTGFYGIQDQRLAIQWVKENIAAFGGNPDRVTLGGQSAGAASVCTHLVAPRSEGLFTRVTMESTFCSALYLTESAAYATGEKVLAFIGCSNKASDAATLACMLNASADSIVNATSTIGGIYPMLHPYEIVETPAVLISQGKFHTDKVFVGNMLNESSAAYCASEPNLTAAQYNATLQASYPTNWQAVYAAYPLTEYPTPVSALISVTTDIGYLKCLTKGVMDDFSRYITDVYVYEFQHYPSDSGLAAPESCVGAAHGFDLYFLYPSYLAAYSGALSESEKTLAAQWRQAFVSYVLYGYPILPNYVSWPTYTFDEGEFVVIQLDDIHVERHYKTQQCPVWGIPSPVCSASVSLVVGSSWSSGDLNYVLYDVKVANNGNQTISALSVQIDLAGATITESWNLNAVSADVYSLPSWYQGFAKGGSSTDAGLVVSSLGTPNPVISTYSTSC